MPCFTCSNGSSNLEEFLIHLLINDHLSSFPLFSMFYINYQTYLTAFSDRIVKKNSGGGERQKKTNKYIYLNLEKENNIKTMVL